MAVEVVAVAVVVDVSTEVGGGDVVPRLWYGEPLHGSGAGETYIG